MQVLTRMTAAAGASQVLCPVGMCGHIAVERRGAETKQAVLMLTACHPKRTCGHSCISHT